MKYYAVVGPEGGIERDEITLAKKCGLKVATLGPWIFKADVIYDAAAL